MKNFLLMIAATTITIIFIPLLTIGQILRHLLTHRSLSVLWFKIALGHDQLWGATVYLEEDWTVSSRTYFLRSRGNRYAAGFEKLINLLLGKDHCELAYLNEFTEEERNGHQ